MNILYVIAIIIVIFVIIYSAVIFTKVPRIKNGDKNGYIKNAVAQQGYSLTDYYVKTAYNVCGYGKGGYVTTDTIIPLLSQGIRCMDFAIFSLDGVPVVAESSPDNSIYVKSSLNSVPFKTVMHILAQNAFSSATCPNPLDPFIIYIRMNSIQKDMLASFASIIKEYSNLFLGPAFSYEDDGKNIGSTPLDQLQQKFVLVIDRTHPAFTDSPQLMEYVNATSKSVFFGAYTFDEIKMYPDINELIAFNKTGLTIVYDTPVGGDIVTRNAGCQLTSVQYGSGVDTTQVDDFFNRAGTAFVLKPAELRQTVVEIPDPTPQNPQYSYATRTVQGDYYKFNI